MVTVSDVQAGEWIELVPDQLINSQLTETKYNIILVATVCEETALEKATEA